MDSNCGLLCRKQPLCNELIHFMLATATNQKAKGKLMIQNNLLTFFVFLFFASSCIKSLWSLPPPVSFCFSRQIETGIWMRKKNKNCPWGVRKHLKIFQENIFNIFFLSTSAAAIERWNTKQKGYNVVKIIPTFYFILPQKI